MFTSDNIIEYICDQLSFYFGLNYTYIYIHFLLHYGGHRQQWLINVVVVVVTVAISQNSISNLLCNTLFTFGTQIKLEKKWESMQNLNFQSNI